MNSFIPPHLETAYRDCQQMAFSHYENFPVASLLLPKETRPHVAALYAFARTADDYADEPPEPLAKTRDGLLSSADEATVRKWRFKRLNQWDQQFKKALGEKPAPAILQAFAHTVRTFQIPPELPFALLRAFRMDVSAHRYSTWNSLLYYCRHSANPVGRMVLFIHGIREKKLHHYSDFICSGLQLINFWQDSAIDLKKGRVYYPKVELKKIGISEKQLLRLEDSTSTRELVKNVADYTENYFRQGKPLLEKVGGRLKLELRATYLGGQGILNKIRQMDYNVLQNRPAWSGMDKLRLAARALFGTL
jgi:squalene synthase HpnC